MNAPDEHKLLHECPPLLTLAAYFDVRLTEDEADRIALHLSRCGHCLDLVADLREAQAGSDPNMTFLPPKVIAAAQELVKPTTVLNPFAIWLRRSAAVAAAVAIGIVGHAVGASLSTSRQVSADSLNEQLLFGMFDASGLSESEFFAIAVDGANDQEAMP